MKITFLGTGTSQGIPIIGCDCAVCTSTDQRDQRLRAAIKIIWDDLTLVVDIGPDFRQQMLLSRTTDLDAILVTHEHNDHVAGLDDVRPLNFKWKKDIPVYSQERVLTMLRERFSYAFADLPYLGAPRVQLHPIYTNQPFCLKQKTIIPIEVLHYKLPVHGFRLGDFAYITDVKTIAPDQFEKLHGTKTLVLGVLQHGQHLAHLTVAEALDIVQRLQPQRTYFTHISHQMGLHQAVAPTLPDGVLLAYDNLTIEV